MEYTISVSIDAAILQAVCGANDANLKTIESILGGTVAVRGNEIEMRGLDDEGLRRFNETIENLKTAAAQGESPDAHYVRAVLSCNAPPDSRFPIPEPRTPNPIRDNLITVPHGLVKVYPRGPGQAAYIQGIRNSDITFCVGPAGTGKTYLAVAMALSSVMGKKARKLVLTRPVVEAGESLGYLPGDLAQKISPYLRPLYDAMEAVLPFDYISRMEENHIIEIAPLAYMRGRSLNDAFIILDEAQNTTKEQMKMFLTRLGQNSRAVITGDITQIDLPARVDSGLLHALSILKGIDGIHFSYLNTADVVRHPLLKKIIAAYENSAPVPAQGIRGRRMEFNLIKDY